VFLQTLFLIADQVLQCPESLYLAAKWAVQHTGKAQVGTNFNGVIWRRKQNAIYLYLLFTALLVNFLLTLQSQIRCTVRALKT